MRRFMLTTGLLTLVLMTSATAAPLLDFTGGTAGFVCGVAQDCVYGWKFTVTSPISVEALGLWDEGPDGLVDSHQIGLWSSGGMLLASTTITTANSTPVASTSAEGNWRFTAISPLALGVGAYVVGATYMAGQADFLRIDTTASTMPGVTFDESRGDFASTLVMPISTNPFANDGYFGPNLSLGERAVVPEPGTFLLVGAGLAGLASIAWRHRQRTYASKAGRRST